MDDKKELVIWLTHDEIECFRFDESLLRVLNDGLPDIKIIVCHSSDEFKMALSNAYAAVVWVFKQEWFELAPKLEWLITPAAGKDYFRVTAPDRVKLHYCSFHGKIMAETVLAMMLASCRGVLPLLWMPDNNLWPKEKLQHGMRPFHGSHVAILGFGSIGVEIGRLSKMLGARITGIKKDPATAPDYFSASDEILLIDELDTLLPDIDHLVLALPGTIDTDNILDGKRLALLPEHAWVYNVGRGNAVDESALVAALKSGRISGACLDVFKEEPLPDDSILRTAPNLLIMPHASSVSPEYMPLFVEELVNLLK